MSAKRNQYVCGLLWSLVLGGACSLSAAGYMVEGVVVDAKSHAAVPHVRVVLASSKNRDQRAEMITNADGRFSIAVSHPGKYTLEINKPGYPPQYYKEPGFSAVETAVVVRDDQDTRHIVFEAWRGGAISGKIKDEDGEPVAYAVVDLFRSMIVGGERKVIGRGEIRANAVGEFRFRDLQSGSYYVSAMGRPWFADTLIQLETRSERRVMRRPVGVRTQDAGQAELIEGPPQADEPISFSADPNFRGTAFQTTFYPNASTVDAASPVRVDTGGEVEISIALPLAKAVSVKGSISSAGDISGGRILLMKKVYDKHISFLQEWVGKDGTFEFRNVPAGSYDVVASSQANSGATSWSMRQEIEVGTADMEVQLRPEAMGSFSGRVVFDGEMPSSPSGVFVALHDDKGRVISGEADAGWQFTVNRVPAGRYEVTALSTDYIAAYLEGASGNHLPLSLAMSAGAAVRQNVALTRAVSAIEGTVEHAGTPQVGVFVLLMPKDTEQKWAYREDQTDGDGSYKLARIPAGDYYVIALSTGEALAYRDAKVAAILAKAAQMIHVTGDRSDLKLELVNTGSLKLPVL